MNKAKSFLDQIWEKNKFKTIQNKNNFISRQYVDDQQDESDSPIWYSDSIDSQNINIIDSEYNKVNLQSQNENKILVSYNRLKIQNKANQLNKEKIEYWFQSRNQSNIINPAQQTNPLEKTQIEVFFDKNLLQNNSQEIDFNQILQVNDDDSLNPDLEYKQWKIREIKWIIWDNKQYSNQAQQDQTTNNSLLIKNNQQENPKIKHEFLTIREQIQKHRANDLHKKIFKANNFKQNSI